MARRRRRLLSDSNLTGRAFYGPRDLASRPRSPLLVSNTLAMVRGRAATAMGPKRLVQHQRASVVARAPVRAFTSRSDFRPVFNFRLRNPCRQRAVRREYMFAAGVAGRGWGAGGPQMRGARRSLNSQLSCRR